MHSRLRGRDFPFGDDEESSQPGDTMRSPAQQNLTRLFEQNQQRGQKNATAKAPEQAPDGATKGKPRLLLMGQRRYVLHTPMWDTEAQL
jgi:hypothetical protein